MPRACDSKEGDMTRLKRRGIQSLLLGGAFMVAGLVLTTATLAQSLESYPYTGQGSCSSGPGSSCQALIEAVGSQIMGTGYPANRQLELRLILINDTSVQMS